MTHRQEMVGYNLSYALNDVFTAHQNLRYSQVRALYRSVYGYGYIIPGKINHQHVRSNEGLSTSAVDTRLQSTFAADDMERTPLTGVDYSRMRSDVNALYSSADPLDVNNPQYGNPSIDINGPCVKYAVLNCME